MNEQLRAKFNSDGSFDKLKFRYVADGRAQQSTGNTFAPVAPMQLIRLFFAQFGVTSDYLGAFDVKSAFLQADRPPEQPVYVSFPPGSPLHDTERVMLLLKSVYGTDDAPHLFYNWFADILTTKLEFQKSALDPAYFYRRIGSAQALHLLMFVDDGRTATKTKQVYDDFLRELRTHVDITVPSRLDFVGIRVDRDRKKRSISLSAPQYAKALVHKMGLDDCRPVSIPMADDIRLRAGEPHEILPSVEVKRYQMYVGSAIFLVQTVRVDLAYAVGQLCRFMHAPTQKHMDAVMQVGRYLKGTENFKITYSVPADAQELNTITAYGDASLGGEHTNGRSTTGYTSFVNNAAFAWSSHLQATGVATATCESELMATGSVAQDTIYNRQAAKLFGFPQKGPTHIYTDNQPALDAIQNARSSPRTRHINLRFHYIRELEKYGDVLVLFLDGVRMPADVTTKPLARILFNRHVRVLSGNSIHGAPTPDKPKED